MIVVLSEFFLFFSIFFHFFSLLFFFHRIDICLTQRVDARPNQDAQNCLKKDWLSTIVSEILMGSEMESTSLPTQKKRKKKHILVAPLLTLMTKTILTIPLIRLSFLPLVLLLLPLLLLLPPSFILFLPLLPL